MAKRRNWPTKQNAREEFPLRGHLICPRCGHKLTLRNALESYFYSLFQNGSLGAQEEIEKLKTEIERNKERLSNAQEMLLDKTLDPADFKAIKSRYETLFTSWRKD